METITINTETIQLDQLLKWAGILQSGGQVKFLLEDQRIRLNGNIETAKRRKIKSGDLLEIEGMQYNDSYMENIYSFVNNINTEEGGTHLAGFKIALTRAANDFARKQGVLKASDANLSGEDVREGLTCVISLKIREPQFEGQTKTKLGNSEIRGIVDSIVTEGLSEYFEENPAITKKIVEKSIMKM